jgi:hypothetical protein
VNELKNKNINENSAHDDVVSDVAWCNNIGINCELISTVGED